METPDPPASKEVGATEPTPKRMQPPATAAARDQTTTDRLFFGLTIAVVVAVLAFLLVPWGPLYVSIEVIDAAVLLGWGALDLAKYRRDRHDKVHLRDGVLLASLGALTIAALVAGVMRDAPRSLSKRQQAKIAETVRPISGTSVILSWVSIDEDAEHLANEFKSALEAGGMRVDARPKLPMGGIRNGIFVSLPDDNRVRDVFSRVFQIAKIRADGSFSPKQKTVEISIGPKPH